MVELESETTDTNERCDTESFLSKKRYTRSYSGAFGNKIVIILEQCLAQSYIANFGCPITPGFVLAGLIHTGINDSKGSQCFSVGESGYTANLSDELWSIGFPNVIDAHYFENLVNELLRANSPKKWFQPGG